MYFEHILCVGKETEQKLVTKLYHQDNTILFDFPHDPFSLRAPFALAFCSGLSFGSSLLKLLNEKHEREETRKYTGRKIGKGKKKEI